MEIYVCARWGVGEGGGQCFYFVLRGENSSHTRTRLRTQPPTHLVREVVELGEVVVALQPLHSLRRRPVLRLDHPSDDVVVGEGVRGDEARGAKGGAGLWEVFKEGIPLPLTDRRLGGAEAHA